MSNTGLDFLVNVSSIVLIIGYLMVRGIVMIGCARHLNKPLPEVEM